MFSETFIDPIRSHGLDLSATGSYLRDIVVTAKGSLRILPLLLLGKGFQARLPRASTHPACSRIGAYAVLLPPLSSCLRIPLVIRS